MQNKYKRQFEKFKKENNIKRTIKPYININLHSAQIIKSIPSALNKYINWDYGSYKNDISVYIDDQVKQGIYEKNNGIKKYLWLNESRYYDKGAANYIKENLNRVLDVFEEIWTYNYELLKLDKKFKYNPGGALFVTDLQIFKKTKNISMISSNSTLSELHKLRYNYAINNRDKIDVFGRGINPINDKIEGLKDYRFSIAIENDLCDAYFTEKIMDCFATGTIPIYLGTKEVEKFFNKDGIIYFEDVKDDLSILTEELYYSKMDAIKQNYERSLKYDTFENFIYNLHFKKDKDFLIK